MMGVKLSPCAAALLLATVVALVVPAASHATALDDANSGLQALNAGEYDQAISLFTRALHSGRLHGDDEEFAYACRGRAYLKKGDLSLAIVDLDRARRARPDDADAQADLVTALATKLPPEQIPGLPHESALSAFGKALLSGALAGVSAGLQGDDGP